MMILIIIVNEEKFLKNSKKKTLSLISLLISFKIIIINSIFIIALISMRDIKN